jgi:hypothetical protein
VRPEKHYEAFMYNFTDLAVGVALNEILQSIGGSQQGSMFILGMIELENGCI